MKNSLQKFMNNTKKFVQHLKRTSKNKKAFRNCEKFCKDDYTVEMGKMYKKYGPYHPTKQENEWYTNVCKKVFCNEKCEGEGELISTNLKKNTKNGFKKTYKNDRVDKLKERGALSGCVDITDYNVFHT